MEPLRKTGPHKTHPREAAAPRRTTMNRLHCLPHGAEGRQPIKTMVNRTLLPPTAALRRQPLLRIANPLLNVRFALHNRKRSKSPTLRHEAKRPPAKRRRPGPPMKPNATTATIRKMTISPPPVPSIGAAGPVGGKRDQASGGAIQTRRPGRT